MPEAAIVDFTPRKIIPDLWNGLFKQTKKPNLGVVTRVLSKGGLTKDRVLGKVKEYKDGLLTSTDKETSLDVVKGIMKIGEDTLARFKALEEKDVKSLVDFEFNETELASTVTKSILEFYYDKDLKTDVVSAKVEYGNKSVVANLLVDRKGIIRSISYEYTSGNVDRFGNHEKFEFAFYGKGVAKDQKVVRLEANGAGSNMINELILFPEESKDLISRESGGKIKSSGYGYLKVTALSGDAECTVVRGRGYVGDDENIDFLSKGYKTVRNCDIKKEIKNGEEVFDRINNPLYSLKQVYTRYAMIELTSQSNK